MGPPHPVCTGRSAKGKVSNYADAWSFKPTGLRAFFGEPHSTTSLLVGHNAGGSDWPELDKSRDAGLTPARTLRLSNAPHR